MILRSFASNQPYTLIVIPLTVGAALLPSISQKSLPLVNCGFPADDLFHWVYQSQNAIVWTSIVLILGGAILANMVFNKHEFHNVPVYVPALMYTMLGTTIALIQLSLPALLANVFVLAALNRHLRIFRQSRVLAEYFESGFWYGLAAVFFPPYLLLIAGLWATTLVMRAFHWREHFLPIVSFCVPFLYWIVWKYWQGELGQLVLFYKTFTYDSRSYFHDFGNINMLFSIAAAGSFIGAIPRYIFLSDRATNKARSVKNIFLIMALCMVLCMLLGYVFILKWILLSVLLPLTFVIGYWFTNYRFSLIAPFVFYFLCVCSVLVVLNFYGLLHAS
jgi:hypothetical protein